MSRVNHFDDNRVEEKKPRSTAAWLESMWEYSYNVVVGKNQLICKKCRGSLGFYSAEWYHVEGDSPGRNDYIRSIIKGHQCGRKTMLDAPKEVLERAGARMKESREAFAAIDKPLSFKHQMDLYKQFVEEEYDSIMKDKTFVSLTREDHDEEDLLEKIEFEFGIEDEPEEPLRRIYRPGFDLCGGSKRFPTGQRCPGCQDCADKYFEVGMWVINTQNGDLTQIESQVLADLMNEQRKQKLNAHLEQYL